ncbi:alpha/beta hydrolase [Sphingosinicella sp. LHD-64]|uniref:alpha/beta hydrolase n=1 Tax=Sphingosinicella sp. LHD-64 TaxID=3072139 RepID=UPI00280E4C93|nr:alpha/beta hydrolase [Sphingosinicella sp. LHD-64]MDQ8756942.1 alpha/beta hydrolase [Sphingosinicella sp. LHD-64]
MSLDRRTLLIGTFAAGLAARAAAQTPPPDTAPSGRLALPDPDETIDLWPDGAPGGPRAALVERVEERSTDPTYNDRFVTGISRPRLVVFRPQRPNGAAALITPGGTYVRVVIDKEGYELARWLAARGVTAFILFYRLPGEGWADRANVPLADAQRAARLIRHRAAAYGIDPARLCAIGFSAGGHVCASLATRFTARVYDPVDAADGLSARPDAAAPIYPVISMRAPEANIGSRENLLGANPSAGTERAHSPHLHVPADAPPCFLLHAEDDATVPVANTLLLRDALRARGIATETHIFPDGGHGFGLRLARGKSVAHWPDLLSTWGRYRGLWA